MAGMDKKSTLSFGAFSDFNTELDDIKKYFKCIKYYIDEFFEFIDNLELYIGRYICYPGESLYTDTIVFSTSSNNEISFWSLKLENNIFKGKEVRYIVGTNEMYSTKVQFDVETLNNKQVLEKLKIPHPELFI